MIHLSICLHLNKQFFFIIYRLLLITDMIFFVKVQFYMIFQFYKSRSLSQERCLKLYVFYTQRQIHNYHIFANMKGLKSKGKSKQPKPQPQTIIKKRAPMARSINNASKQFTVHFFKGKVIFNISQIDPILQRTLIYAFRESKSSLSQASVLQQLKIAKHMNFEVSYKHYLDTKQAILLYNRLIRRRLGQSNKVQQLKEILDAIESYPIQRQQLQHKHEEHEEERQQLNQDIERLRRQVKTYYVQAKQAITNSFKDSQQYFKAKILQHKIRNLSVQLIDKMIVAIRQVSEDKIQIIFEQPYPQKGCKPQFLIKTIGYSRYIQKKIDFVRHYRNARLNHKSNTNFIVCHVCKQLLFDTFLQCDEEADTQLRPTYQNSPNAYYRNLIALDYCYHPPFTWTKQNLEQELDYFKYSSDGQANICNRFICSKCFPKIPPFDPQQAMDNYKCEFCKKSCNCESCLIAKQLVKSLALYKQIIINNFQPIEQYYQLVKFANLDHETEVQVQNFVRNSVNDKPKKQYFSYYNTLIQNFKGTNNVMDRLQLEAVRSFSLFQQTQVIITQQMSKIRQYCLSLRLQEKQIHQGKKLPQIKRYYQQSIFDFPKYIQNQKRIHDTMQTIMKKSVNFKVKKEKKKQQPKSLFSAQSFMEAAYDRIPQELNFLYQTQQHLQFTDQQIRLTRQKLSFLRPLDKLQLKKLVRYKNQAPFDQIDYDLAINVKKSNKILVEKDFQLMKNGCLRIMFDEDHPIYGWKGLPTNRFHNEQQQFIQLLQESEDSDSSEEVYQGDSSFPNPGSISISNSFLRKHQIQVNQEESCFSSSEQQHFQDNVSSSFILHTEIPPTDNQQQHPPSYVEDQQLDESEQLRSKDLVKFENHMNPKLEHVHLYEQQFEEQAPLMPQLSPQSNQFSSSDIEQIPKEQWRKYVKQ